MTDTITIPAVVAVEITRVDIDWRYCNATAKLADGTQVGVGAFLTLDRDLHGAIDLSADEYDRCRRDGFVIVPYSGRDETWVTIADGATYDEGDVIEALMNDGLVWECEAPDYEEIFERAVREKVANLAGKVDLAHAGDVLKAMSRL